MTNPLKIFLVGEVSSGKSSFLNAISGGIISNASTQRETMVPEIYSFVDDEDLKAYPSFKKIATILEKKHICNKEIIAKLKETTDIKKPKIISDESAKPLHFKSMFEMGSYEIYDFPGLNDSQDSNNVFFQLIEQNILECDCFIYITQAETAFVKQSEVDLFNQLKKLCDVTKSINGKYIKLCIAINKFDDENNMDPIQIAESVKSKIDPKIPIFRISSHKLFIANIMEHKLVVPIPKFMQQEIKKIFQNANVITTKAQKDSIKNNGKIRSKFIEFNEDIDSNESDDNNNQKDDDDMSHEYDSGSDFEDDPIESAIAKPEYNNTYKGDWNNLIEFITDENKNLPENKSLHHAEWISNFLKELPQKNFSNISIAKNTMDFLYVSFISSKKEDKMTIFIKEIKKFIENNFNNFVLMCSLLEFLISDKITLSKSDKKILGATILSQINTAIENNKISNYHVYIFIRTLEKISTADFNIHNAIKILQTSIIWESTNDRNPITYYDWNTNTNLKIFNTPSPKYHSVFVERTRNALSNINDICILIDLCIIKKNILKLLYFDNKIPTNIISKYLDENAINRLKIYLLSDIKSNNVVPFLFNQDMTDPINIEIVEYLETEKLFKKK